MTSESTQEAWAAAVEDGVQAAGNFARVYQQTMLRLSLQEAVRPAADLPEHQHIRAAYVAAIEDWNAAEPQYIPAWIERLRGWKKVIKHKIFCILNIHPIGDAPPGTDFCVLPGQAGTSASDDSAFGQGW